MKKTNAIIAITALAILATTMALVSCKKDNGDENPNLVYDLSLLQLFYCFDSYLGLGYGYISTYPNECPVNWKVTPENEETSITLWTHYHELNVEYGLLVTPNPPGPFID